MYLFGTGAFSIDHSRYGFSRLTSHQNLHHHPSPYQLALRSKLGKLWSISGSGTTSSKSSKETAPPSIPSVITEPSDQTVQLFWHFEAVLLYLADQKSECTTGAVNIIFNCASIN